MPSSLSWPAPLSSHFHSTRPRIPDHVLRNRALSPRRGQDLPQQSRLPRRRSRALGRPATPCSSWYINSTSTKGFKELEKDAQPHSK